MPFDLWGQPVDQPPAQSTAVPAAPAPLAAPTWPVIDPRGNIAGYTTDPTLPPLPGYTVGKQVTEPPPAPGATRPTTTQFGGPVAAPTAVPPPPGGVSVAAQPPAPPAPAAPAVAPPAAPAKKGFDLWGQPLDQPAQPAQQAQPGQPTTTYQPPKADGSSPHSDEPWYQHLGAKVADVAGNMASGQGAHELTHSFSMGFDDLVGPLVPAIADAIASGSPANFAQHYEAHRNSWVQAREQYEKDHPAAADVMSGIGMLGSMALPFGAAARGASLAAKLGRGIATGAGVGAAGGFGLTEGDPLTAEGLEQRAKGAVIGGVTGAALAPVAEAIPGVVRTIGGVLRPTAQAPRLAGQVLTEAEEASIRAGGGPLVPRPAPAPGVPLNLAEATGSPEIATLSQQRGAANIPARVRHETAQSRALRSQVPGVAPGEPVSVAVQRSTDAEAAIRQAAKVARSEEKRLWNRPSLQRPTVTTGSTKVHVNDLAQAIRDAEPGLNTDALNNGSIQSVIRAANNLPDRAAANQINGIASQFGRIARNHTLPGEVRAVAGRLQRAAQDGLMNAPEVVGRPPQIQPRGWHTDHTGKTVWHNGGVTPAIRPDPQLVRDMRAARDFTKRKADVFGHASFDSIWQRNSYGNQTLPEGTGLGKFFNFSTGTMKPGQIKDAAKFMDDIATEWRKLGHASFDPADAVMARQEMVDNTRDFITASLLQHVSHPSQLDDLGDRMLQMGRLRTAIARNRRMLTDSGVYTPAQLDMWDRIAETAQMIQQAQQKGAPIGSPTYSRVVGDKRFMDALFGGPIRRYLLTGAAGTLVGGLSSHLMGMGEFGGALLGDVGGMALNAAAEHIFNASRTEVLRLLDEALRDPAIAQDLMRKVSGGGTNFSAVTKRYLQKLGLIPGITGAHVGAAYAPPMAQPAQ